MSKYLYLCSSNRDRSVTAEKIFSEKHPEHEHRSAGINHYRTNKYGTKLVDRELCEWADKIICMEEIHQWYICEKNNYAPSAKITILYLGDTEKFMSEQLVNALHSKAEELKIFP